MSKLMKVVVYIVVITSVVGAGFYVVAELGSETRRKIDASFASLSIAKFAIARLFRESGTLPSSQRLDGPQAEALFAANPDASKLIIAGEKRIPVDPFAKCGSC